MSDPKFTPGPWTFEYVASGGYDTLSSAYRIKYGEDSRRSRVCEVDTRDYNDRIEGEECGVETSEEAAANAHLIAAAPELLEALQALLAEVEDYQRINHLGGEQNQSQVMARAAIAKAEGRE